MEEKPYRMEVYERFAELVSRRKLHWVMLHGAEHYPQSIGRDLDCLCESTADTAEALACFRQAAEEHADTAWVITPHPIWGQRCVAVSSRYESAELHILPCLSSGPIFYRVNYSQVDWSALFPQDKGAFYTKAVLLPLLANSKKVLKTISAYGEERLPDCVRAAYETLKGGGQVSATQRLAIYRHHCPGLFGAVRGVAHSLRNKLWRYFAHTVPVFYLNETYGQEELQKLEELLKEPFLKFVDCTHFSKPALRCIQSQQYFLYVRKPSVCADCVDTKGLKGKQLCDFIMDCFAKESH